MSQPPHNANPLSRDEFNQLVKNGYNRIPLMRQISADFDTPLSAYVKLANSPYSYLFESVHGGEKWGRYSIIGLACEEVIHVTGDEVAVYSGINAQGESKSIKFSQTNDPLAFLEDYQAQFRVPELPNLPRFHGGLVGYMGYETIRYIEPKLANTPAKQDDIGVPDILMMRSDEMVVFDNLKGQMNIIVHVNAEQDGSYDDALNRLDALAKQLRQPMPELPSTPSCELNEADFVSGFTEQGFKDAVTRCKQYIKDGDIMQVVLSQRMSTPFKASALDLYRALRSVNPSPYMYYLNMGNHQVVGSSPEILVRLEDGDVTVRPIAGTRKRGKDEATDKALEQELLNDPKELAEHLMLIDLGRNDAGRVAQVGTVELTDKMLVERYSHVMHIVSNVQAKLKEGLSPMDVIRATFPAGTVSGAPKVRAMEIIDELEPVKRGIYSGAIGYIGWNGNLDTAIAIRTAVVKDGTLHMQAGAGLVYDSVPDLEWKETLNKSRAIFSAATLAESGIDA